MVAEVKGIAARGGRRPQPITEQETLWMEGVILLLKFERMKRKWTQPQVGAQIGVSGSQISLWECGSPEMTVASLVRWASAFELDIAVVGRE